MNTIEYIREALSNEPIDIKGEALRNRIHVIGSEALDRAKAIAAENEAYGKLIEEWPDVPRLAK